jgi:hypothetical protein
MPPADVVARFVNLTILPGAPPFLSVKVRKETL